MRKCECAQSNFSDQPCTTLRAFGQDDDDFALPLGPARLSLIALKVILANVAYLLPRVHGVGDDDATVVAGQFRPDRDFDLAPFCSMALKLLYRRRAGFCLSELGQLCRNGDESKRLGGERN